VVFTYLKVKPAKCLCLLQVVLVLSFWSWSCYFGLGLKNLLVLFMSLTETRDNHAKYWGGDIRYVVHQPNYWGDMSPRFRRLRMV